MVGNSSKIALVGTGNIAYHLYKEFTKKGISVQTIVQRNINNSENWIDALTLKVEYVSEIPSDSDLVIVCVNDDQIEQVLNELNKDLPVAYTSGSVSLNQLPKRPKLGVFYPLQTFTKHKSVDFEKIPLLIEANDTDFQKELMLLAQRLSNVVQLASSQERFYTHVAAVFVNNFSNHMYHIAAEFLANKNMSFSLLHPLLLETTSKVLSMDPAKVQTGPAKRKDVKVIHKHLEELVGLDKEVYEVVSKSIMNKMKENEL